MRIEGRVAVVTGAERGLGWALAMELARKGARVVVSGLAHEPLARLRATIAGTGGRAMALACDIRDPGQITTLVAEATRTLGAPDLLVNNAGVTIGGDIRLISERDWERALEVNLLGAVRMVKAVVVDTLEHDLRTITMSEDILSATLALRGFLFAAVYENEVSTAEFKKASGILGGLWEKVKERPEAFVDTRTLEAEGLDVAICDFIAGMTDRYAVALFEHLFVPRPWTIGSAAE